MMTGPVTGWHADRCQIAMAIRRFSMSADDRVRPAHGEHGGRRESGLSPDGTIIAFVSTTTDFSDLWVLTACPRALTKTAMSESGLVAGWAIAYSRDASGQGARKCSAPADGTDVVQAR
jgi:hypothetical protein